MSDVRVLVLRSAGTNCDRELGHAFRLAGAEVEAVHINALLKDPSQLERFQVMGLPGGFSYGDDIASGKILANQLIHHLKGPLKRFVEDGKLILGVCNGFQVLVKSGLLPGSMPQLGAEDWHPVTLTYNPSGKFEDRWVRVRAVSKHCKWIPAAGGGGAGEGGGVGGVTLELPIAHGEGRFVPRDDAVLQALRANDQVVFEYVDGAGERAKVYPDLPNGSVEAIAGICDVTGRVLGLMPHPERVAEAVNHPRFSRGGGSAEGLVVFKTAMAYVRSRQALAV